MSFTDDDFMRMKKDLDDAPINACLIQTDKAQALLARLEAAEAVIHRLEYTLKIGRVKTYQAWLRSKGESK